MVVGFPTFEGCSLRSSVGPNAPLQQYGRLSVRSSANPSLTQRHGRDCHTDADTSAIWAYELDLCSSLSNIDQKSP